MSVVKETRAYDAQTLWVHCLIVDGRRSKIHPQIRFDDQSALAIVQVSQATYARVNEYLRLELRILRPMRRRCECRGTMSR